MSIGKFNKKKLIDYVLSTYEGTLYESIFNNKLRLIDYIFKLSDKDFYNIIIHLNRKSYIGYYSLHISNNLSKAILDDDWWEVQLILENPKLNEIFENEKLSDNFKEDIRQLLEYEKIAYNMLLEKCTLDAKFKLNNNQLVMCKKELNIDLDDTYFDRHKTTMLITKKGEDIEYDVNELIYRCLNNITDYDNDHFNSKITNFIKDRYINEIAIIKNYLLNKK